MFAVGACRKKDGWVISMYKRVGDPLKIMKIRKAKASNKQRQV